MKTKIIHIHLIFEKKDFYFGSFNAIFKLLNENQIGITKTYLSHLGLKKGNSHVTKRAIIKVGELIRNS